MSGRQETFMKLFMGMDKFLNDEQLRVYIDITFSLTDDELSAGVERMLVDPGIARFPTAGQLLRYCRPARLDLDAAHTTEPAPDAELANLGVFGGEQISMLCWTCQESFDHFEGYANRLAALRRLGMRAPLLCTTCAGIHLKSRQGTE